MTQFLSRKFRVIFLVGPSFYWMVRCLVEERESHVVVGLLLLGLLLLLLLGGGTTGGGTSGSGGRGGSTTNVGDEVLDVLPLQELGEESWPVWLNLDSGGLHDGGDLVGLALRRGREASSSLVPRDLVVVVVVAVVARVWCPRPTLRLAQGRGGVVISLRSWFLTVMAMPSSCKMRAA